MTLLDEATLNQSFYSGNYTLQIADWEYILRSIITHSKTAWLRSSMEFAPNIPREIRNHLIHVQDELIASDALKTWELEISGAENPLIKKIITNEEHAELHEIINHELNTLPSLAFKSTSIDRGAKNVDLERDLWNIGLANYCGVSSLIFNSDGLEFGNALNMKGAVSFNLGSEFAKKVFEHFKIRDLWRLTADQILTFQESSRFYQKEMDVLFENRIYPTESYIESRIKELAETYETVISEMLNKGSTKSYTLGTAADLIINTAGIFVPIISFLPIGPRFYDWVRHRNTRGFAVHMYELKKATKK